VNRYYNVGEVASACTALAAQFGGLAQTFELAEATHKGLVPPGLRVGDTTQPNRPVFMLVGELHGDEWGGCEILLGLASDLLQGQATGLDYGNGVQYSAAQVQSVLQGLDLVLVPLVNPDGRAFSQGMGESWRKNRRKPAQRDGPFGVDLNRNFDFRFDLADANESSRLYRGPSAFSEPETRNVKALVEQHEPNWFADLHSGARCIVYPRSVAPTDAPPLPPQDLQAHIDLASVYAQAAGQASGTAPGVTQGFDFTATGGTSFDWVYARNRPPGAGPTLAFMIEWSVEPVPLPPLMDAIVRETGAGLIAMFLEVLS
jgi:hypothetical protein